MLADSDQRAATIAAAHEADPTPAHPGRVAGEVNAHGETAGGELALEAPEKVAVMGAHAAPPFALIAGSATAASGCIQASASRPPSHDTAIATRSPPRGAGSRAKLS